MLVMQCEQLLAVSVATRVFVLRMSRERAHDYSPNNGMMNTIGPPTSVNGMMAGHKKYQQWILLSGPNHFYSIFFQDLNVTLKFFIRMEFVSVPLCCELSSSHHLAFLRLMLTTIRDCSSHLQYPFFVHAKSVLDSYFLPSDFWKP